MRLCHRCGYMQPGEPEPAKDPEPSPELLELRNLQESYDDLDGRLDTIEEKIGIILEIVMAQTEPARQSVISKVRKRAHQRAMLEMIREANRNGHEG